MVSVLLFLAIISSGSIFASVRFHSKFGRILPITCMSCILFLFFFGVLGNLLLGVYLIVVIAVILYFYSGFYLIIVVRKQGAKTILQEIRNSFFSVGFVAFAIFLCIDFYCIRGTLVSDWDDFSHWATTVKQMTLIDKLSTAPEAVFVCYKYYLPGTALFQYLLQKITVFINPGSSFSEWRLFFAQHILIFSLMLPVCEFLRKKISSLFIILGLFFASVAWYSTAFSSLQVDFMVSLVFSAGLFSVFSDESAAGKIYVLQCVSFLVLIKTAGMLPAAFLAMALICVTLIEKKSKKITVFVVFMSILAVCVPKMMWNYNMAVNDVMDDAGTGFNLSAFVNLLNGKDNSYRVDVLKAFFQELLYGTAIELCGVKVRYIVFVALAAVMLIILAVFLSRTNPKLKNRSVIVLLILFLETAIYIFGLLVTYLFHFVPREALGLASFHRYIGISLNAVYYTVVFWTILFVSLMRIKRKWMIELAVGLILLISVPYSTIRETVTRETVYNAYVKRYEVNKLCEKAKEFAGPSQSVYFIHQGNRGYTYWMSRFIMMPTMVNPLGNTAIATWNFGNAEDGFTKVISPDDFRDELKDTCDYVILHIIDDYFAIKYDSIFNNPNDIYQNSIYSVDKTSGKLSLVCRVET